MFYGANKKPAMHEARYELSNYSLVYIQPANKNHVHANCNTCDPCALGQKIFHTLAQKQACHNYHAQKVDPLLFVSPESSYAYALNRYPEIISLWQSALPDYASFLIGAHYQSADNKRYQAVYWLNKDSMQKIYCKKHCVAFVENMPSFYEKYSILRDMFLRDVVEFCPAQTENTNDLALNDFVLSDTLNVLPQVCSEFFCTTRVKRFVLWAKITNANKAIMLFVNDSWFNSYFRNIMKNLVYFKSGLTQLPIIYIGHTSCFVITV